MSKEPAGEKTGPKKKRISTRKIIGIVLIIIGLSVVLYVPATWLWSYAVQRGLPDEFSRESADACPFNQEILNNLRDSAEDEKLEELARDIQTRLASEQTIAQLEIPKIGINTIVVEGTSDGALRKGPGHLEETQMPGLGGNFAVAGDRVLWGGPFLNLDEMAVGDQISVITTYGKFEYVVYDTKRVTPDQTNVLAPTGEEIITLITCDPIWDTSHRLIVHGRCTSASVLQDCE